MVLKRFNVEREETDPAKIRELKAEGYKELEPEKEEASEYSEMSKAELVALADAQGIENAKKMTKAALVNALEER